MDRVGSYVRISGNEYRLDVFGVEWNARSYLGRVVLHTDTDETDVLKRLRLSPELDDAIQNQGMIVVEIMVDQRATVRILREGEGTAIYEDH